jgi:predicted  nucleic acid-binding Zn-ribbon protein
MSAALGLFRLQQIDRQLDQSNARISAIREILGNDAELKDALGRVEQASEKKKTAQRLLNESEELVRTQQIKIEQGESSLYGGNIHNPKDLQDLQSDVASLKRYLTTLEERELEAMLGMDTVQEELGAAEAALVKIQTQRGDHHRQLIDEQATLLGT